MTTRPAPLRWPPYTDFDRIAPKLYVGAEPDPIHGVPKEFQAIAFCAREIQPDPRGSAGTGWLGMTDGRGGEALIGRGHRTGHRIIRIPLPDDALDTRDLQTAFAGARLVASAVAAGRRVLVTCHLGVNRSAFVAALALRLLRGWTGARCLDELRARRHPRGCRKPGPGEHAVLTNRWFAAYLLRMDRPR
jgi:hypothetical protein